MFLASRTWGLLPAGILAVFAAALSCIPASAQEKVDVELVLAVDVSLSMSMEELEIQRRGYLGALTSDGVLKAITQGAYGRIAVTYVEWAGNDWQRVVVPWTIIASAEDANRFTDRLAAEIPTSARRTSISGALKFALDLFAESGVVGMKRVVDVSGDGPNNEGSPVADARDALVAKGITINGLPLMTNGNAASAFAIEDLDEYYANCVIGGPGAFIVPVNDWQQFPDAVRRKLIVELAGGLPPARFIKIAGEQPYDCLVGEKMWNDRSRMWRDP